VAEIFQSIQGEGSNVGIPMTFIRLAGCNLRCPYCDTKNSWADGKEMTIMEILDQVSNGIEWVCITGGEPTIQNIDPLIDGLRLIDHQIALETNGTLPIPKGVAHVTVSPKAGGDLHPSAYYMADEFKFVIEDIADFDRIPKDTHYSYVYLQPVDNRPDVIELCVKKILEGNNSWRLSIQMHKLIKIK